MIFFATRRVGEQGSKRPDLLRFGSRQPAEHIVKGPCLASAGPALRWEQELQQLGEGGDLARSQRSARHP
ncbi:MAG TPA: hypothetical protein VIR58_10780 [Acidimicrobiales bacterium]